MGRWAKFGNTRTEYLGISFQSKLEASVYQLLKLREAAKEIEITQIQGKVLLSEAAVEYRPDFKILDIKSGQELWVEAKGHKTPEWKLKLRLYRVYGSLPLELWEGDHKRPYFKELILPKYALITDDYRQHRR